MISFVLQNVTFFEHHLLDKIAFYLKLSAKISLKGWVGIEPKTRASSGARDTNETD